MAIKALSISQPWAWAILHGKDVENRDWKGFPAALLGQMIGLHASRPKTKWEFDADRAEVYRISEQRLLVPAAEALPTKAIIGCFRVREVIRQTNGSPWWNGSRLALVLYDVRAFRDPIPVNGALGLWEVKGAEYNEMRRAAACGHLTKLWG